MRETKEIHNIDEYFNKYANLKIRKRWGLALPSCVKSNLVGTKRVCTFTDIFVKWPVDLIYIIFNTIIYALLIISWGLCKLFRLTVNDYYLNNKAQKEPLINKGGHSVAE